MKILMTLVGFVVIGTTVAPTQQMLDAQVTWEQVLTAKGGRGRLHSVKTLVWSSDEPSSNIEVDRKVIGSEHHDSVEAYPDRFWRWSDFRPGRLGISIEVFNGAKRLDWQAKLGDRPISQPLSDRSLAATLRNLRKNQLVLLLDSAFVSPVIKSAMMNEREIVLEGSADGFSTVRFVVNKSTYLPKSITLVPLVQLPGEAVASPGVAIEYVIQSYSSVSGIQLPAQIKGWGQLRFVVNPEIDPALFETPPSGTENREHWRRFTKTP